MVIEASSIKITENAEQTSLPSVEVHAGNLARLRVCHEQVQRLTLTDVRTWETLGSC